jgi:hypothetical protein
MEEIYKSVLGYEKLVRSFGCWPSFHDSEIVSARLDRDQGDPFKGPVLTVAVHLFRLEAAPEASDRNNTLTTICFRELEKFMMSDFNHQNAVEGLVLTSRYSERLRRQVFGVHFLPGFGMDCSFECGEIEVLSVEPFTPKW